MPPKYWPKAISIRALMEFAPSWNSRHFYRGGIVQRLSNAAERFIDRDHGYIDGRLRLRHRVLGIELRALRIQQDQKIRDALPVLRVGELRGAHPCTPRAHVESRPTHRRGDGPGPSIIVGTGAEQSADVPREKADETRNIDAREQVGGCHAHARRCRRKLAFGSTHIGPSAQELG